MESIEVVLHFVNRLFHINRENSVLGAEYCSTGEQSMVRYGEKSNEEMESAL